MAILADEQTKVLVQGITGREAASFTKDMMEYGTQVVAGVTPGKKGQSVYGVPVFDTVAQAMAYQPADAAIISVPPLMVKEAALESLLNGIKLLVIVTERVPRKDTVELLELARQTGATVIGPNTLGLISPGVVKLGMAGGRWLMLKSLHARQGGHSLPFWRYDHRNRQFTNHQRHWPEHLHQCGRRSGSGL